MKVSSDESQSLADGSPSGPNTVECTRNFGERGRFGFLSIDSVAIWESISLIWQCGSLQEIGVGSH